MRLFSLVFKTGILGPKVGNDVVAEDHAVVVVDDGVTVVFVVEEYVVVFIVEYAVTIVVFVVVVGHGSA